MASGIHLDGVYRASPGVVARSIDGEVLIVPVQAGIGSRGDELYALNDTGAAVWSKIDGTRSLRCIIAELAVEYHADEDVVQGDVMKLGADLLDRGILVASSG